MGPRPEALSSPAGHRVAYCDSSAILRAYMADEDGYEQMRHLLAEHDIPAVTPALAVALTDAQDWPTGGRSSSSRATPIRPRRPAPRVWLSSK